MPCNFTRKASVLSQSVHTQGQEWKGKCPLELKRVTEDRARYGGNYTGTRGKAIQMREGRHEGKRDVSTLEGNRR